MKIFTVIADWANEHPGRAAGAFLGFLIGLMILIFGFLKTLFVAVLAAAGFWLGRLKDNDSPLAEKVKGLISRRKG